MSTDDLDAWGCLPAPGDSSGAVNMSEEFRRGLGEAVINVNGGGLLGSGGGGVVGKAYVNSIMGSSRTPDLVRCVKGDQLTPPVFRADGKFLVVYTQNADGFLTPVFRVPLLEVSEFAEQMVCAAGVGVMNRLAGDGDGNPGTT